jgi:hypothetical protein
MRTASALLALLCLAGPAGAHQIWIEQPDGQDAVVRFDEFGQNPREASPGLLDKFEKPAGSLALDLVPAGQPGRQARSA